MVAYLCSHDDRLTRLDQNGRLNDENLDDQVREVVQTLLNQVKGGVPARLVA